MSEYQKKNTNKLIDYISANDPTYTTIRKLRHIFKMRESNVEQLLINQGVKPVVLERSDGKDRYNLTEAVQALVASLTPEKIDLTEAKTNTEIEKTKKLKLENAESEGSLHHLDTINSVVESFASVVKSAMRNVAFNSAREIAFLSPDDKDNQTILEKIISKEVNDGLRNISDTQIRKEVEDESKRSKKQRAEDTTTEISDQKKR